MKIILSFYLFILLSGCSFAPKYTPAPDPTTGESLVYLMRGDVSRGYIWSTQFTINDRVIANLKNYDYTWVNLKPGKYRFKAAGLQRDVLIEEGKTYYFEYHLSFNGYQYLRNFIRPTYEEIKDQLFDSSFVQPHQFETAPKSKVRDFYDYQGENKSSISINYNIIYKNTYPIFTAHVYDDYMKCEQGAEYFPKEKLGKEKHTIPAGTPLTFETQAVHSSSLSLLSCVQTFTFTPKQGESYKIDVDIISKGSMTEKDECILTVTKESDSSLEEVLVRSKPLLWTDDSPRCDESDFKENIKTKEFIQTFNCRTKVTGEWRDC